MTYDFGHGVELNLETWVLVVDCQKFLGITYPQAFSVNLRPAIECAFCPVTAIPPDQAEPEVDPQWEEFDE